jgi:hypothetical protein
LVIGHWSLATEWGAVMATLPFEKLNVYKISEGLADHIWEIVAA